MKNFYSFHHLSSNFEEKEYAPGVAPLLRNFSYKDGMREIALSMAIDVHFDTQRYPIWCLYTVAITLTQCVPCTFCR